MHDTTGQYFDGPAGSAFLLLSEELFYVVSFVHVFINIQSLHREYFVRFFVHDFVNSTKPTFTYFLNDLILVENLAVIEIMALGIEIEELAIS